MCRGAQTEAEALPFLAILKKKTVTSALPSALHAFSLPSPQFSHLLIIKKHKHILCCYCHSRWGFRNEKLRVFFLRASGLVRVSERMRVETTIKIRNCYSVQEKPQQTRTQLFTGDNTEPRFSTTKPVWNHFNVHSEVAICWAWLNMYDCFIMKYFRHKKNPTGTMNLYHHPPEYRRRECTLLSL